MDRLVTIGGELMSLSDAVPEPTGLLKPYEVAAIFGVDAKTVSRWARRGLISCIFTPGGHRRFNEAEVRRLRNRPDLLAS